MVLRLGLPLGAHRAPAKAVVARSFDRIDRSNLVGMGVLPLQFKGADSVEAIGIRGDEEFDIVGLDDIRPQMEATLAISCRDGLRREVRLLCRIDMPVEVGYYRHGGILSYVLRALMTDSSNATPSWHFILRRTNLVPNTRNANAARLEFAPDSLVQSNLSGAAFTGDWLSVAGDEACGVDRLRRLDPLGREALRFGEVRDFPLTDLLDLPGTAGEEADLEGLAVDGRRLLLGLRGPVLRGWSALTESVSLPHGRATNRAEAICDLPPALSGGKAAGSCCTTGRVPIARRASTPSSVTCCATIEILGPGLT